MATFFGPGFPQVELKAAKEALYRVQEAFAKFPDWHHRAKACWQAIEDALCDIGQAEWNVLPCPGAQEIFARKTQTEIIIENAAEAKVESSTMTTIDTEGRYLLKASTHNDDGSMHVELADAMDCAESWGHT